ncbi:MAG: MFS transporter, partial [Actinomycetota bacterium]|nr:MFS transporter [Actinomycetota bacterium]
MIQSSNKVFGSKKIVDGGQGTTGRLSFFVLLISQLAATAGFMFVMPFMPLYVQQLGVEDAGRAAAWAGLLNTATAVTMATAAPLWGRLADRLGHKPMLLRATLAGAVVVGCMGLVTAPWQLLLLRLLQGTLTGTVAAATVLVSATAPSGREGQRLGTLQMVIFLAAALGPFAGGLFADLVGIRASFGVTAALLAASGIMVLFGVGNTKPGREASEEEGGGGEPVHLKRRLMPVLAALFVVHLAMTGVVPAIPGFLASLVEEPGRVAGLSGQIIGVAALAAAAGSLLGGRLVARFGPRWVVIFALMLAGLAFLPQAGAGSVAELWVLRILASFFLGIVIPVVNLAVRSSVPPARQGAAFG